MTENAALTAQEQAAGTDTPATAPEGPCAVFWGPHACNLTDGHKGKHLCACEAKPTKADTLIGDDLHIGSDYAEGHR